MEHCLVRPAAKTTTGSLGPCACAFCAAGLPWVRVEPFPQFRAAAVQIRTEDAMVGVRVDSAELRRLASLCLEAAQELEDLDEDAGRGVPLCRLN